MADYPISNVPRRIVYTGSAGVGPYAFAFEVLMETDINVYKNNTLLTLTTDYTVYIDPDLGTGDVTLVSAAIGTDTITIVGSRAVERTSDFTTGGDLFATTLNEEFDSQTILIQQVAETAERGLRAPVTDPTSINMVLPSKASRASKYLSFDNNGNPVATAGTGTPVPVGTLGSQDANNVSITGGAISGVNISGLPNPIALSDGGLGAVDAAGARTNLELGDIAVQNASAVAITGGDIDGVDIGAGTPGTVNATSVTSTGGITSSGGGIGYTSGAGGTITQLTSKATGVTLNELCGLITMNAASLAAATTVSFTLTNSTIAATDILIMNQTAGTLGSYLLNASCASGSVTISVRNITAAALAEAVGIRFAVIKSVIA